MKLEHWALLALFALNVLQYVGGMLMQRELWNRITHPDRIPGAPPPAPRKTRTWTDADEAKVAQKQGESL
jgi:hypothetical protein